MSSRAPQLHLAGSLQLRMPSCHLHSVAENCHVDVIKRRLLRSRTALHSTTNTTWKRFLRYFSPFPLQGREQEAEGIMKVRLTFCFLDEISSILPRISTLIKQYGVRRSSVTTVTTLRAGRSGLQIPVGEYLISNHSQNGPGAQPASTSMGIDVLPRG